ncbi:MAG: biotin--[Oscillospiraceae bacterium]|nr:biotin--[acetyl-CoA-carboxylase] ligase [Oscillospiraceae bacterium]
MICQNELHQTLCDALRERGRELAVEVHDCIDSTNTEAKRRIAAGDHSRRLILAQQQTAGRGRLGRSFYSPDQTGLYMTLILGEAETLKDGTMLTIAAATAAALAIESATGEKTDIKWVNDIYMRRRKVCGILCEAVTDEKGIVTVLAGIGVNVATREFPEELLQKAGALPVAAERGALAAEIADRLLTIWEAGGKDDFLEQYRERSFVPGNRVCFERGAETLEALAIAVDDAGGLVVRYDDGREESLRSGEVSVKIKDQLI